MNRSLLNQRYVPLRKLAEGGMAEIYLARQTGLAGFQREVVLKLLQRRLSDHPKAVEMFLDEARLAASLCHSNIVQIFDVGEEEGAYFIVMERVQGASLRALAETTSRLGQMIPMEFSVNIIIQVLEGLRYAHDFRDETGRALKIVHRDICPSNLLVTFDGVVKIVDFGIARAETQLRSETGMRPGKFAYMAPEVVVGEPVDARADLFGVGVLLYELTVGQRLIRAASFEALTRVVDAPIPPPTFARAGYPVDLEILVMRALERDPADRFGSAEEMLEELEQFAFNTGLRVSRLRLGKLVAKTMGRQESALSLDVPGQAEESAVVGDELDFDRASLFDGSSRANASPEAITSVQEALESEPAAREGAERVRRVMEAVQQANEAIAELVAASGLEEEEEEGRTIEMRAAQQAALRADTVEPEGGRELSEPSLPSVPAAESVTQVVSAEQIEEEEPMRDGSALVVTDELVEEEEELDPGDDLLRDPSPRGAPPEVAPLEQPAPPARVEAAPAPRPSSPEAPPPSSPATPAATAAPAAQPEASSDLLEALADISAELRAAEESDRRREEALSQAIELFTDTTLAPPGRQAPTIPAPAPPVSAQPVPAAPATPPPAAPRPAVPVPPPPSARRPDHTGPLPPIPKSSREASRPDELEATDGARRAPDELELSDLARSPLSRGVEPELEADGETIVLQPEESSVELVLDGAPQPASAPAAPAAVEPEPQPEEPPALQSVATASERVTESDEGLDAPTLTDSRSSGGTPDWGGPDGFTPAGGAAVKAAPDEGAAPRKKGSKRKRRRRR